MGFRGVPGDPFANLPGELLAASLRMISGRRPAHPAVEETDFPAMNVYESPEDLVIEAELPGVDPERIGVSAAEGLIVIEGTKEEGAGPGRVNYLCMERCFGAFRRVVLPDRPVDIMRATASYRDGLLQVRVPKVAEKRGRSRAIPVSVPESAKRSEP